MASAGRGGVDGGPGGSSWLDRPDGPPVCRLVDALWSFVASVNQGDGPPTRGLTAPVFGSKQDVLVTGGITPKLHSRLCSTRALKALVVSTCFK